MNFTGTVRYSRYLGSPWKSSPVNVPSHTVLKIAPRPFDTVKVVYRPFDTAKVVYRPFDTVNVLYRAFYTTKVAYRPFDTVKVLHRPFDIVRVMCRPFAILRTSHRPCLELLASCGGWCMRHRTSPLPLTTFNYPAVISHFVNYACWYNEHSTRQLLLRPEARPTTQV